MSATPESAADGVQDYCTCYSADDCTCRLQGDGFGPATPEWAADGPEVDTLGCWVDVPEYPGGPFKPCAQDTEPGSTLCAHHRARLAREQAEASA